MTLAEDIAQDLTQDEALRLFVYDDASGKALVPGMTLVGHPTIGVGRALDVHGISPDEARSMLATDIEIALSQGHQLGPWWEGLDDPRKGVLAEMIFNLGLGHLQGFHQMLAAVASSDWATAKEQMLQSHWATQVAKRAVRLANIMLTGERK